MRTSCNSYLIPGTRVHNSISELSILRDVSHLFTACSEKFASLSFYPIAIELSNKRGLEARLILLKCARNIFMTIFQLYFRTVFKFLTISGTLSAIFSHRASCEFSESQIPPFFFLSSHFVLQNTLAWSYCELPSQYNLKISDF